MSSKSKNTTLKKLISDLPEIYQPIYTHPEYSTKVSRECQDRLEYIVQVYNSLANIMQRPLRVLDLGSAQGYFSFILAEIGASVHGVDYLDENVAVCNELVLEHKNLDVSFQIGRIEDFLGQLESGQYDLVLGLSVFHHIVHEQGAGAVDLLLSNLASKVEAGIFEFAQSSEPLYWAEAQPEDPRQLLKDFSFTHELSQNKTHLSEITRPLYFASNRFWYFSDQIGVIDSIQTYSHEFEMGTHLGTRHYYFDDKHFVKQYSLDKTERYEVNLAEFHAEITFLGNPPPGFNAPRLVLWGQHESEAWVVRSKLPGELLFDIIKSGRKYDQEKVLSDILKQLVALEEASLYHNDLRTWNILIDAEGGAALIDYGAISKGLNDCGWPNNLFLSFIIFAYEVTEADISNPVPMREARISPLNLKGSYRRWIASFWTHLASEWSFKLLHEIFIKRETLPDNYAESAKVEQLWMKAMEEYASFNKATNSDTSQKQNILEIKNQGLTLKLDHLETQSNESNKNLDKINQGLTLKLDHLETQSNESNKNLDKINQGLTLKLDHLETQSNESNKNLDKINQGLTLKLDRLEALLSSSKVAFVEYEATVSVLREELFTAKYRLEELSGKAAMTKKKAELLSAELNEKTEEYIVVNRQIEQLTKKLEEARSKIDGLNHSSHHWWLESERLNKELQTVYSSKSWWVTWPLRKLLQFIKWFFYLPIRLIVWLVHLPKRSVLYLLVKLMSYVYKRPSLKLRARRLLRKYPKAEAKLRKLGAARQLILVQALEPLEAESMIENEDVASIETLLRLTPSARQIYGEIKVATVQNRARRQ